jgi:hypothetical protein
MVVEMTIIFRVAAAVLVTMKILKEIIIRHTYAGRLSSWLLC